MKSNLHDSYAVALSRIDECRESQSPSLNLAGLGLSSFPPKLWQLTFLATLDLSNNRLGTLPDKLQDFKTLGHLDLSGNRLVSIPPQIQPLTSLYLLNLSNNLISEISEEIKNLTNLRHLYLNENRISQIPITLGKLQNLIDFHIDHNNITSLPPQAIDLPLLHSLSVSGNKLKTLPKELGKLSTLQTLYFEENNIEEIPEEIGNLALLQQIWAQDNELSSLPQSISDLPSLEMLFLHGNKQLRLPTSILGADPRTRSENFASAKAILDFYFARLTRGAKPLNEIKLIFVGRGGAGKTSIVNALQGRKFRNQEDSTPGIALCDWDMNDCKDAVVTAHVWDFAGQIITHALHQFFFSSGCFYVLVLTGRENSEREDAEYWLRLIKAFGSDDSGEGPPVLVALNKWDTPGCRPKVDKELLKERYPFIREFVEMDCTSPPRIATLKAALCSEVNELRWVRDPFPEEWDFVRRALSGLNKRAHMPYSDFKHLCSENGVIDEGEQDSLAEILHNLGTALNYRRDPRLREATVLQPDWLTQNVYALMRKAENQSGILTRQAIDDVLIKEPEQSMRSYLLHLMERFEIAYAAKSERNLWLIPQALPDSQPKEVSTFLRDTSDPTKLRYWHPYQRWHHPNRSRTSQQRIFRDSITIRFHLET